MCKFCLCIEVFKPKKIKVSNGNLIPIQKKIIRENNGVFVLTGVIKLINFELIFDIFAAIFKIFK